MTDDVSAANTWRERTQRAIEKNAALLAEIRQLSPELARRDEQITAIQERYLTAAGEDLGLFDEDEPA